MPECFYGYVFYQSCHNFFLKRLIFIFIFFCIDMNLLCLLFYRNNTFYFSRTLIISGFFLAAVALMYIYEQSINERTTVLVYEPGFWIAFGVSLFFSGISIVFSLHGFIMRNNLLLFGIRLYKIVPRVLCIILYSSISIAIILCKKKNRISL